MEKNSGKHGLNDYMDLDLKNDISQMKIANKSIFDSEYDSPLEYLRENYSEDVKKMVISEVFYSKKFVDFVEFCTKNELYSMYDLKQEEFDSFLDGIQDPTVRNRFGFTINNIINEMASSFGKFFFELEYLKKYHSEHIKDKNIDNVFISRKFLLFRDFCKDNGIKTLIELRKEDIVRFSFNRSVGRKKTDDIVKRIKEFLLQILGDNEDGDVFEYIKDRFPEELTSRPISEVFKEYKFVMFKIYCDEREIENIYELDQESQNMYFEKYDVVENKKKLIKDRLNEVYLEILKENLILKNVDSIDLSTGESGRTRLEIERNYYKSISIDTIIPDKYTAYQNIKRKLEENNVNNLLDLLNYDVTKLKYVSGVGEKRYSEFHEHLEDHIKKAKTFVKEIENEKFELDEDIFEIVKDKTIREILNIIGLRIERKAYNEDEISNYQGINYIDIGDYSLVETLISIQKSLNEIINIKKTISDLNLSDYEVVDRLVLERRIIGREPLEIVGEKFGLSAKKVAHVEDKILTNINTSLRERGFIAALKMIFGDERRIEITELEKYINPEDHEFLKILEKNQIEGLFYIEDLESIGYLDVKKLMNDIRIEIKKLPYFGELDDLRVYAERYHKTKISDKVLKNLIKLSERTSVPIEEQLKIFGKYYYKANISKIKLFEFYLRYFHTEPIHLDNKSVSEFNDFFYENFGMRMSMNKRSLEGLAFRSDELILVNPRTYSHIHFADVNEVALTHMKKILDIKLMKKNCVNAREIYEILIDYYPEEFWSKHHVYSLISYHFTDYKTSKGNSLDITLKGKELEEKTNIIYDICKKYDSIVDMKKLKKETEWPTNRIYNAIDNSSEVMKLGPNKCTIVEDILNDEVKAELKKLSEEEFKEGYAFTYPLFNNVVLENPVLAEFVEKYNIDDPKEIASLIKYVNPGIYGNNNFLYRKDQEITTLEEVIRRRHGEVLYRNEIEEFLLSNGYSHISVYQTISRILDKGVYVQVDVDKFVLRESLKVEQEYVDILVKFAKEESAKLGYFIPNNYLETILDLGVPGDICNQFIITYILSNDGFKVMYRQKMKNNMDVRVLVPEDSKYDSIDHLAYDIIVDEYKGEMNERDLYDFLAEKGIYQKVHEVNFKKMYKDMKQNGYIVVDKKGNITLK